MILKNITSIFLLLWCVNIIDVSANEFIEFEEKILQGISDKEKDHLYVYNLFKEIEISKRSLFKELREQVVDYFILESLNATKHHDYTKSLFILKKAKDLAITRTYIKKIHVAQKNIESMMLSFVNSKIIEMKEAESNIFEISDVHSVDEMLNKKLADRDESNKNLISLNPIEIRKRIPSANREYIEGSDNFIRDNIKTEEFKANNEEVKLVSTLDHVFSSTLLSSHTYNASVIEKRSVEADKAVIKICNDVLNNSASLVVKSKSKIDYRWLHKELKLCVWRKNRGFRLRLVHLQTNDNEIKIELYPFREKPVFVKAF